MTAAVIPLPTRRVITAPALSREDREYELMTLAWEHLVGGAPTGLATQLVALACAHDSLTDPMAAWADYLAEYQRALSVEAGDPEWRDLEPGMAEADRDEALRYLLDGDRPKAAGDAS